MPPHPPHPPPQKQQLQTLLLLSPLLPRVQEKKEPKSLRQAHDEMIHPPPPPPPPPPSTTSSSTQASAACVRAPFESISDDLVGAAVLLDKGAGEMARWAGGVTFLMDELGAGTVLSLEEAEGLEGALKVRRER